MNTPTHYRNERCAFTFDHDRKEISGTDLTDRYNEPRCYSQTSRSYRKALQAFEKAWNDNATMYGMMNVISDAGVRMRSYCAMD